MKTQGTKEDKQQDLQISDQTASDTCYGKDWKAEGHPTEPSPSKY